MGTGDNAGTWGAVTNVNLGTALEESIAGTVDVAFSSSDITLTLTDDNTAQAARNMRLNLTGTSGGARNLIVPAIEKMYVVNNGLADACTVKVSGQTGVSVPAGKTTLLFNNGTDIVNAINALADLAVDTNTLYVDSTNNRVGIGTSSPANKLEVSGAIVAQGAVTAYTNTGLYLQNKGSSVVDVGAWRSGASVAELSFSTDSGSDASPVERMRIDSSGNVGIGTNSPAVKLHVSSTGTPIFRIQDADDSDYYAQISQATGNTIFDTRFGASNGAFIFRGLGGGTADEYMRINSSGNVGIGTSSPAATVDVSGNARGAVTTDNDLSFDLSVGNNFSCTPTGAGTLTFTNHLAGQSGFVLLDNSGGHAIAAAATTKINAADLTTISTAGVYTLSYFDNGTNAYVSVSRSFA